MLCALFALSSAHAAPVEMWSQVRFPEGEDVAGTDGWLGGYDEDPWFGYTTEDGTSWAFAGTDDDGGDWGTGDALDNFIVNPAVEVHDGVFEADFYNGDDDSIGIVIGQQDAGNYYLFVFCGAARSDSAFCPLELDSEVGSAIVRIQRGEATILAQSSTTYADGDLGSMSFQLNDGVLTAEWEEGGLLLEAEDTAFTSVDSVGFWSYNAGADQDTSDVSYIAFSLPTLYALDEDDDAVIDDLDNCEFAANPTQDDTDGDGEGDVCDETPGDTDPDPGTDDTGGTDTDPPGGGGKGGGDGLVTPGSCGCDGAGGVALGAVPLLLAALAARRRRAG